MSHRAPAIPVALAPLFCNFVGMPPSRCDGTRVASTRRVPRALCAAALALGGCLITDPAHIDDPVNAPPAIRSTPEAESDNVALNQIIRLDWQPDGELELPIIVRDENVADELVIQAWIDFAPQVNPNEFQGTPRYPDPLPVLTSTGAPDREFSILIPYSYFGETARCHRVEVFVTRRFAPTAIPHRVPETEGDIGTATFWIAMRNTSVTTVDMSTCP